MALVPLKIDAVGANAAAPVAGSAASPIVSAKSAATARDVLTGLLDLPVVWVFILRKPPRLFLGLCTEARREKFPSLEALAPCPLGGVARQADCVPLDALLFSKFKKIRLG